MSGESAPGFAGRPPEGDAAAGPLTPERIDAVLADFRGWLEGLGRTPCPGADAPRSPELFDLHTLVAQFTALRHEINLQTKAARAVLEQNTGLLKKPEPAGPSVEHLKPLVKTLLAVRDALDIARRQMAKAGGEVESALADRPRPGFVARLFGERPDPVAGRLRQFVASALDGYGMSLGRIDRALADLGLEPIGRPGEAFDPETMEAVDTVGGGRPGTVAEVARPGYRWNGSVVRFAQVVVAK